MSTVLKTSGGTGITFAKDKAVSLEDGTVAHGVLEKSGTSAQVYQKRFLKNRAFFGPQVFEYIYNPKISRKGTLSYYNQFNVGTIKVRALDGQPLQKAIRPKCFSYPKKGKAGTSAERVARAVKYGKSVYLYGPSGTGKSDLFRAISYDMNMEFSLYPMREDLDTALYIGQMQVVIDPATGNNKTEFKSGKLLEDIKGRVGRDGIRRPVMIVIDDIDRAPAEYHEVFRHILDGNQGVFVPELGVTIDVFPGTLIMATANSRGRGDDFGNYSSVQSMDDSILDRFGRFVEYHYLEGEEEEAILIQKFPDLFNIAGNDPFLQIMNVTGMIRKMIENKEVYIGFSHRTLTEWCESVFELTMERNGKYDASLIKVAASDWLERYDEDTRSALLKRVLNIKLK